MSDELLRRLERDLRTNPEDEDTYARYVNLWLKLGRRDPRKKPEIGDLVQIAILGWSRQACNVIENGFAHQRRKVVGKAFAPHRKPGHRHSISWQLVPPAEGYNTAGLGTCLLSSWRSWVKKGQGIVYRLAEAEAICGRAVNSTGWMTTGASDVWEEVGL